MLLKKFIVRRGKNNNLKAVVFAYHNMGITGLEALARHHFEIAAIFTSEDDPDENCWFDSVQKWAEMRNIPVYTPEEINSGKYLDIINNYHPDIIFSFYYRKMIGRDILAAARIGAFNLHGSLLPHYRGRCPVNWVLVNGETKTGVTLHYMIDKPDAGDIVGQKEIEIEFADTAKTLYGKLCRSAALLLDELLPGIAQGKIPRHKQNLAEGGYFGGRKPEDGRINWDKPAREIYNLIRAVTDPYPGAFAFTEDNEKIMIWWAQPEDECCYEASSGDVMIREEEVLVQTGENAIKLKQIEVAGRHLSGTAVADYFKKGKVNRLK